MAQASAPKATVLVLAASRQGPGDAVAKLQNVSHKCLVDLDGTAMLERVVNCLIAARDIDRIFISIEQEDIIRALPALAKMLDDGTLFFTPSKDNLFASVTSAVADINDSYPLVITTGDNALHTPDMIDHFTSELFTETPDVAVAMTPAQVILDAYPDGKRAFHELKDGGWSSCNLYALMSDKALKTAKVFEGGGQFGKKPERLLKAFGLGFVVLYKFKLATIDGLASRLSRRWSLALRVIKMPFADAPIDVDNPGDFERTVSILEKRRRA